MIKFITLSFISIILILSSSPKLAFPNGEKRCAEYQFPEDCLREKFGESYEEMCAEYQFPKDCLREKFRELYIKNYEFFSKIMNYFEKEAVSCADLKKTSEYLSLIEKGEGNAEMDEVFSDFIEKLALSNPTCLLDSLLIIKDRPKKLIIWNIKNPVYRDKEQIGGAIQKYRNQKPYIELFREMDQLTSYPQRKLLKK